MSHSLIWSRLNKCVFFFLIEKRKKKEKTSFEVGGGESVRKSVCEKECVKKKSFLFHEKRLKTISFGFG